MQLSCLGPRNYERRCASTLSFGYLAYCLGAKGGGGTTHELNDAWLGMSLKVTADPSNAKTFGSPI